MSGFPGLIGPVEDVRSLSHAGLNNVAIVLRNGVFDRVVIPGKRFMRGFRAPALGSLQVIQVNTGSVSATLDLHELPCAGGFLALESITVSVEVQANPEDGYAGIADLVRRYGATFGSVLFKETRAALEHHVRTSIQSRTPDELFVDDLATHLGARRLPIPIGSLPEPMRLTHLVVDQAVWHEGLAKARRQSSALIAGQVDAAVEVGAMMAKVEAMQELSAATGIPAALLANPDIRQLEAQRWDVVMKLLEPGNRAALTRHPQLLEAAMSVFQSHGPANGNSDQPAINPVADPFAAISAPASSELTLSVDQALANAWRKCGGGPLLGIGGANVGDSGTVVIVKGEPAMATFDDEEARRLMARLVRSSSVTIHVVTGGSLDDVVRNVLHSRGGASAGCAVRLATVDRDGLDELEIYLSSDGDLASQAVSELTAPGDSLLAALEELLPHATVVAVLDPTAT